MKRPQDVNTLLYYRIIFIILIFNLGCSKKQFDPFSIVNAILIYEKDKELQELNSYAKISNYNVFVSNKFKDISCYDCDTIKEYLKDFDREIYSDFLIKIDTLKFGLKLYSEFEKKDKAYTLDPKIKFSYPILIDKNLVYIKVRYSPFGNSKLYAYKLMKENNNWSIVSKKLISKE